MTTEPPGQAQSSSLATKIGTIVGILAAVTGLMIAIDAFLRQERSLACTALGWCQAQPPPAPPGLDAKLQQELVTLNQEILALQAQVNEARNKTAGPSEADLKHLTTLESRKHEIELQLQTHKP